MSERERNVLVVDDEPAIREALRRSLSNAGYRVHTADTGETGLEVMRREPIQLVISDKDMPGMDGVQFLGIVRDRHPRVCRVLLTGRLEVTGLVAAINEGEVHRFVEKPWSTEHLLSTLHFAFETLELQAETRRLLERSDRLLLNVLPRSIAARLKVSRDIIADRYPAATVLFSDLVDFTTTSTKLEPRELVGLLNDVFSAFDTLAEEHGVEKIKTLGDGYLAAAGLPEPRPDHIAAIVDVALRMPKALAAINGARGTRLELRIGVHTGPVVAGVIGLKRFSYDLWGDTVNVASRMESQGVPGRVHVTRAVADALANRYIIEPRGAVHVKGKGPLETFFVVEAKP